jgi:hypothetical protein
MGWRKSVLLGLPLAMLAGEVRAATLTVASVARPRPGWLRIAVRYAARHVPAFRLTPDCAAARASDWVVAATVSVLPERHQALLDLPDDLAWLGDRRLGCTARGLTVEMLQEGHVAARAEVPLDVSVPPSLTAPPPPEPAPALPRLGFVGQKTAAPQTRMSQAGVTWSVSDSVKLQLSYERTGYAPTMARDHDDGILTGVRLGF